MSEEFVFYNGKKLRKGYTTGSCATAAATAAALKLFFQETHEAVNIALPNGENLLIPIEQLETTNDAAVAGVIKDGGDDVDATHGILICAEVTETAGNQIEIEGGVGVGRVTEVGLPISVGLAAINPTPRKMIEASVRKIIGPTRGAKVTIFVPEGESIAKQTMNRRLGIVGGISILGTSGIVTPMSEDGWKQAISIELTMKKKQGLKEIILVPGNYGEDFAVKELGLDENKIVSMSNFVGYVLKEVQRLAFEKVLIVGHLGKLIKVAAGIFSTHSKDADARNEIMVANLALMGAPLEILQEVAQTNTTEAAGDIIAAAQLEQVYQILVDKIQSRCQLLLKYRSPEPEIDVVLFSSKRGFLAATKALTGLKEEWR